MRIALVLLVACGGTQPAHHGVVIDRFSKRAAHALVGKWPAGQAIDCPVVPTGTRPMEGNPTVRELTYRGTRVECLQFGDPLTLGDDGHVPTSPIYLTTASDGLQTHNVVFSLPGDADYSPLWALQIYDERAFSLVHDEATARRARVVKEGPLVNCPVVRWRHD